MLLAEDGGGARTEADPEASSGVKETRAICKDLVLSAPLDAVEEVRDLAEDLSDLTLGAPRSDWREDMLAKSTRIESVVQSHPIKSS
jgi:hypothetical protein